MIAPIPGAGRHPSVPSRTSGAYSGGVRSRAAGVESLRRSHHTRLSPAFFVPLRVRIVLPPASCIVSVTSPVGALFSQ